MKKVGIVSLGCSKNLVDSENILGLLDHNRYLITNDATEADIIIVNTCGFIDDSKKESIKTIFDMLSYEKKVVVVGCLVERYYEQIKEQIPEISLIIPIRDYYRFNELLSTIDDELD
ncbi:MAG: 30S ribosomal protein S12 methylthiotransferase RimO, partial [Bacilli bacterium]|nr:30S ribosomal protein S12 methylthiotransferase RimO [Bacilli bacterium]